MRISDWSSDVCSSDLRTKLEDGLSENTAELVLIGCDTGAIEMAVRLSGKDKSDDRFSVPGAMIVDVFEDIVEPRSEEHTSELQSLMRISYAVFCLKKKLRHRGLQSEYEIT